MAFDYASRDYDTIKADLLARATRVLPEWTSRDSSDFGMLLVDLWAQMGDVLHYYVDRAANEHFLVTATQRESVLALANLLDYTPSGRTSAVGSVTFTNTGSEDYDIAPYTRFVARYNNSTYQVYTRLGGVISGGSVSAPGTGTVDVFEGTIVVDEILSTLSSGIDGQSYTLSNGKVVTGSIEITVNESGTSPIKYTRVERLATANAGDRVFSVNVNPDGESEIVFGSGVSGFPPPTNSLIKATYAYSSGAAGNIPANSVADFLNQTPVNIAISSSTAFTGGADEESLSSMRTSVPSIVSSQNRAVTRRDYTNSALRVDGVSKAAVSYAPPASPTNNASVTIYAHPPISDSEFVPAQGSTGPYDTAIAVPASTREAVENEVTPKSMIGVNVYTAASVGWELINLTIDVNVSSRFVQSWVEDDVVTALDSLFSFDRVTFGQTVNVGQIYRTVLNVRGVDYAEISAFYKDSDGSASLQSAIAVDSLKLPRKGTFTINMNGGVVST
jgi:uncharacterized phage protein gp47/JayE